MNIILQNPRTTEASFTYESKVGMVIKPKFYVRQGSAPVVYIDVVNDDNTIVHRYYLSINGKTAFLRLTKLSEVIPDFHTIKPTSDSA